MGPTEKPLKKPEPILYWLRYTSDLEGLAFLQSHDMLMIKG